MNWDGMYSTFDADGSDWFEDLNERHMSDDTLDIVRSARSEAHNFVDFTFSDSEREDLEVIELKSFVDEKFPADSQELELRMAIERAIEAVES
jgi:hypothetical protein